MKLGAARAPRVRHGAHGVTIVKGRLAGSMYRKRLRAEMIAAYGSKCACCAEATAEFLTIEHLDGGGNAHRRAAGYNGQAQLVDLKRQGWPQEGYTLLCWNCQFSKAHHGSCPHTWTKPARFVD